jgi:hypothetical protein
MNIDTTLRTMQERLSQLESQVLGFLSRPFVWVSTNYLSRHNMPVNRLPTVRDVPPTQIIEQPNTNRSNTPTPTETNINHLYNDTECWDDPNEPTIEWHITNNLGEYSQVTTTTYLQIQCCYMTPSVGICTAY